MIIWGLYSAGRRNSFELVVFEASPDEHRKLQQDAEGKIPRRIRSEVGSNEFRVVHLLGSEKGARSTHVPLAEFHKRPRLPRLIYSCPWCREGGAHVSEEMTFDEFRRRGGSIMVLGDLKARDA